jgi:hypothetical protein
MLNEGNITPEYIVVKLQSTTYTILEVSNIFHYVSDMFWTVWAVNNELNTS